MFEFLDMLLQSKTVLEGLDSEENSNARIYALVLYQSDLLNLVASNQLQIVLLQGGLNVMRVQVDVLVLGLADQKVRGVVPSNQASGKALGLDKTVKVLNGLCFDLIKPNPKKALNDQGLSEVAVSAVFLQSWLAVVGTQGLSLLASAHGPALVYLVYYLFETEHSVAGQYKDQTVQLCAEIVVGSLGFLDQLVHVIEGYVRLPELTNSGVLFLLGHLTEFVDRELAFLGVQKLKQQPSSYKPQVLLRLL